MHKISIFLISILTLCLPIQASNLIASDSGEKLNLTLKRGGSILSQTTLDKLKQTTSLSITGTLYETDLAIIEECKHLKVLDLGRAHITLSPTEVRRRKEREDFARALLGYIGASADYKYRDGKMSSMGHALTKRVVNKLRNTPSSKQKSVFFRKIP